MRGEFFHPLPMLFRTSKWYPLLITAGARDLTLSYHPAPCPCWRASIPPLEWSADSGSAQEEQDENPEFPSKASRPPAQGSSQWRFGHSCSILEKITNPDARVKPRAGQGSEPPFHNCPRSSTPLGLRHSPRILTFGSSEYIVQPSSSQ